MLIQDAIAQSTRERESIRSDSPAVMIDVTSGELTNYRNKIVELEGALKQKGKHSLLKPSTFLNGLDYTGEAQYQRICQYRRENLRIAQFLP